MERSMLLIFVVIYRDVSGMSMSQCSNTFCYGNGNCKYEIAGRWSCHCVSGYYGGQCHLEKESFSAKLNLKLITIKNRTWTGRGLTQELRNTQSTVYGATEKVTGMFIKQTLQNDSTYIGGKLEFSRSQELHYKLEFKKGSNYTIHSLQQTMSTALRRKGYVLLSENSSSMIDVVSFLIRDYDECNEVFGVICGKNKRCRNTQGSFHCDCNTGFVETNGLCSKPLKSEGLAWTQITIWGGIVLVVLIWMITAILCTNKRRRTLSKHYQESKDNNPAVQNPYQRNDSLSFSKTTMERSRDTRQSFSSTVSVSNMDSPRPMLSPMGTRRNSDMPNYASSVSRRSFGNEEDQMSLYSYNNHDLAQNGGGFQLSWPDATEVLNNSLSPMTLNINDNIHGQNLRTLNTGFKPSLIQHPSLFENKSRFGSMPVLHDENINGSLHPLRPDRSTRPRIKFRGYDSQPEIVVTAVNEPVTGVSLPAVEDQLKFTRFTYEQEPESRIPVPDY